MRALTSGDAYGPLELSLSAEVVEELLDLLGVPERGRAVSHAPTGLLAIAALHLMERQHVIPPGSVHAEQEVEQLAPVPLGTTLVLRGVIADVRLRKNRRWVTVAGTAHGQDGALFATTRTTVVLPPEPLT